MPQQGFRKNIIEALCKQRVKKIVSVSCICILHFLASSSSVVRQRSYRKVDNVFLLMLRSLILISVRPESIPLQRVQLQPNRLTKGKGCPTDRPTNEMRHGVSEALGSGAVQRRVVAWLRRRRRRKGGKTLTTFFLCFGVVVVFVIVMSVSPRPFFGFLSIYYNTGSPKRRARASLGPLCKKLAPCRSGQQAIKDS